MMKKEYVKPEFLVEDILLETMIATSSGPGTGSEFGGDGSGEDADANERRGSWGDFWN